MKRILALILAITLICTAFYGCKKAPEEETATEASTTEATSQDITAEPSSEESTGSSEAEPTSKNQNGNNTTNAPTKQSSTNTTAKVTTTERQSVKVTIPEGFTFMQVANRLESKGVCSAADFYKAAQAYEVKSFTIPSSSNRCFKLEGYLYPDTYEFYTDEKPETVIRRMLNNYAAKSGMPSDETLILASIIEKETRSSDHMKMVSSVFHNRLDDGMKLEADSTREYVNKNITGNSLLGDTGKYAGLYNTYKCKALPAGPICSPGKRAIDAAKNPSSSEYLFFFFGNDNDNHYSKTLEEHEAQMKEFGVQYGH